MQRPHLLTELVFPSHYEQVVDRLGSEVARLLVSPDRPTSELLETVAYSIKHGDEGLFCPMYASSGTGKTTLASNLSTFQPDLYSRTLPLDGVVTAAALRSAATEHRSRYSATNDDRVLPINIDSREAAPATAGEMAEIKQFLREPLGRQSVVLWPTTDLDIARQQSRAYEAIAGSQPVDLPLMVSGPARGTWQAIAINTLTVVNHVESLDMLCNPRDYEPDAYPSLGEFIKAISRDFTATKMELLRSTRKPLSLTILFTSESSDHGVLSNLGSGVRFGFLDGSALIGVTPGSEVGRWWDQRRGLLTQTLVQLDAHAFCLPPTVSVAVAHRYGPEATRTSLDSHPVSKKSETELLHYLRRSDFGRHLLGERRSAYETRGNPGAPSRDAYRALVAGGHIHNGRDKALNKAMVQALEVLLRDDPAQPVVAAENKLSFCQLIPDVKIETEKLVHCIEFAWRKNEYLDNGKRSDVAQYILTKLRNYARELGWYRD